MTASHPISAERQPRVAIRTWRRPGPGRCCTYASFRTCCTTRAVQAIVHTQKAGRVQVTDSNRVSSARAGTHSNLFLCLLDVFCTVCPTWGLGEVPAGYPFKLVYISSRSPIWTCRFWQHVWAIGFTTSFWFTCLHLSSALGRVGPSKP